MPLLKVSIQKSILKIGRFDKGPHPNQMRALVFSPSSEATPASS